MEWILPDVTIPDKDVRVLVVEMGDETNRVVIATYSGKVNGKDLFELECGCDWIHIRCWAHLPEVEE